MGRLRYLNPLRIRSAFETLRDVTSGGGPRRVRLARVHEPRGLIVPTAEIELEVETRDGSATLIRAAVPLAWPLAWGYRLARAAGVPYLADIDHDRRLGIAVPVPRVPGL